MICDSPSLESKKTHYDLSRDLIDRIHGFPEKVFCVLYVCVFVFKSFSIPPEILKAPQRMAFCMKRLQYPSNNTQPGFVKIF